MANERDVPSEGGQVPDRLQFGKLQLRGEDVAWLTGLGISPDTDGISADRLLPDLSVRKDLPHLSEAVGGSVELSGVLGQSRPLVFQQVPGANAPDVRSYPIIQGETSDRWSQRVSEDARREGLGRYAEQALNRDDGRTSVAAAKTFAGRIQQLEALSEKGVTHGWGICEIDSDTGLKMREVLTALEREHPEIYHHPKFKATVLSQNAHAIRSSKIFARFGSRVEVLDASLDEAPKVPEGTLLALYSGAEEAPVYRVSRPKEGGGKVAEIQATTIVTSGMPLVMPKLENGTLHVEMVQPSALVKFGAADAAPQRRLDMAAKLGPNVQEVLTDPRPKDKLTDPNVNWLPGSLNRRDRETARFMRAAAPDIQHIRHYTPALQERLRSVVSQLDANGMCLVDGRIREGQDKGSFLPPDVMTEVRGMSVRNLIEKQTLDEVDKHAHVFLPSRDQDSTYTQALIDRSGIADLHKQTASELERASTQKGSERVQQLLDSAQSTLDAVYRHTRVRLTEKQQAELERERAEAQASILRDYDTYVRGATLGNALPSLNSDLPRGLARLMHHYGYHQEAVRFAGEAIRLAPHADSESRVLLAKSYMALAGELDPGTQPEEARASMLSMAAGELKEAVKIAPRSPAVYHARAQLAMEQGNQGEYAAAVLAALRCTSRVADPRSEAPRDALTGDILTDQEIEDGFDGTLMTPAEKEAEAVVKAWRSYVTALERDLESPENAGTTALRVECVQYNQRTGDWELQVENKSVPIASVKAAELADLTSKIAATLHQYLALVSPERKQWQDELVAEIIAVGERSDEKAAAYREATEGSVLTLSGDAATKAAEFDSAKERTKTMRRGLLPRLLRRERKEQGVTLGEERPKDLPDGEEEGAFTLKWAELCRHLIIEGVTGAGKTETEKKLIVELAKEGVGVWVVDMGSGSQYDDLPQYLRDPDHPDDPERNIADVTRITIGDRDAPAVALGLLKPEPGFDPERHIEFVRRALAMATRAEEPFPQLINTALHRLKSDAGEAVSTAEGEINTDVLETPKEASMKNFLATVMEEIDKAGYSNETRRSVEGFMRVRLNAMHAGTLGRALSSKNMLDIADLYERPVVHWDLTKLSNPADKALIGMLIAIRQAEYLELKYGGVSASGFKHFTLWEEANRVWNRPENPLDSSQTEIAKFQAEIISMIRRYEEGYGLAVQNPEKLIDEIDNAGGRIIHQLLSDVSRTAAFSPAGVERDDPEFKKAVGLDQGYAYVARGGSELKLVKITQAERLSERAVPVLEPKLLGSLQAPDGSLYTHHEIQDAVVKLAKPEYASWVTHAHLMTVAQLTGQPLPSIPASMREQYNGLNARERYLMLHAANEQAIELRAPELPYNAGGLEMVSLRHTERMLDGVPLAGSVPGTEFLAPELTTALYLRQLQDDAWTRAVRGGDEAYVPPFHLPGHTKRSVRPLRAKQARERLQRLDVTPGAKAEGERRNIGRALIQLLGSDMAAEFSRAARAATQNEPDLATRYLKVTETAGIWKRGDPVSPWPYELLLWASDMIPK